MDIPLSPPAEITAEWTVHAQLTIVRGDPRAKSPAAPDDNRESVLRRNGDCNEQTESPAASLITGNAPDAPRPPMTSTADRPLRVVYKWSTDDLKASEGGGGGVGRNGRGLFNLDSEQVNLTDNWMKIDFCN